MRCVCFAISSDGAHQAVLAAGPDEPIGDEHESPVRERGPLVGLAQKFVEQLPQAQLLEERAHDQHGSPGRGFENVDVAGRLTGRQRLTREEALQLRQQRRQDVSAAEVGDGALLDLAVLPVGFDDADVFVDGALGGGNLDGAQVHAKRVSRPAWYISRSDSTPNGNRYLNSVTTLFGSGRSQSAANREKQAGFRYRDNGDM